MSLIDEVIRLNIAKQDLTLKGQELGLTNDEDKIDVIAQGFKKLVVGEQLENTLELVKRDADEIKMILESSSNGIKTISEIFIENEVTETNSDFKDVTLTTPIIQNKTILLISAWTPLATNTISPFARIIDENTIRVYGTIFNAEDNTYSIQNLKITIVEFN